MYYKLGPNNEVQASDFVVWVEQTAPHFPQVALDWIDGSNVSTIFYGSDRVRKRQDPQVPEPFETQVEDLGDTNYFTWSTWEMALQGHEAIVVAIELRTGLKRRKSAINPNNTQQ